MTRRDWLIGVGVGLLLLCGVALSRCAGGDLSVTFGHVTLWDTSAPPSGLHVSLTPPDRGAPRLTIHSSKGSLGRYSGWQRLPSGDLATLIDDEDGTNLFTGVISESPDGFEFHLVATHPVRVTGGEAWGLPTTTFEPGEHRIPLSIRDPSTPK